MEANRLKIFSWLAWIVSAYHFALGLIGTFAPAETIAFFVNKVYGVAPTVDAQFIVTARFISIFMIALAITMAILARSPMQYRNLVWVPITLFSVRIVERLVFFDQLQAAYGIDMMDNMRVIVPIAVLGVALFYFRPKA